MSACMRQQVEFQMKYCALMNLYLKGYYKHSGGNIQLSYILAVYIGSDFEEFELKVITNSVHFERTIVLLDTQLLHGFYSFLFIRISVFYVLSDQFNKLLCSFVTEQLFKCIFPVSRIVSIEYGILIAGSRNRTCVDAATTRCTATILYQLLLKTITQTSTDNFNKIPGRTVAGFCRIIYKFYALVFLSSAFYMLEPDE
ncbi:hypothetical protein EDC96DRAFT_548985 [Choanephora cucurbitarum]|nr:hypothetical protein EDC96DRAFT_548985 [Choanephora cucurbitarum]